jgi:ribosome-binding factor A
MKKESRRAQRVADVVRAELSRLLLLEAHDPDLKRVTVTDVEMPSDLRSARVFFSCLGGDDERTQALAALRRAAGYLRREVGQRCQLRYAPELHFVADRSLERGARIEELLLQVRPADAREGEPGDEGGAGEPE